VGVHQDFHKDDGGKHSLDQKTSRPRLASSTPESDTVAKDEAPTSADNNYVSASTEDDLFTSPVLEGVTVAEQLGTEGSLASEHEGTAKLQETEEIGVQIDDPKAIGGDTGSTAPSANTGIPDVEDPRGDSSIDLSDKVHMADGRHTEESEPMAYGEQAEESDLRSTRNRGGRATEGDRHTDQTLAPSDRNAHEPIANRADDAPDHSDDDSDQFHDARMELPPSEPPSPVRTGMETSTGSTKSPTISSPIAEEAREKNNGEPTILDSEGQGDSNEMDGKLNAAKKGTVESLKAAEGASDEAVDDEGKTTDSLDADLSEQKDRSLKETILDLTLEAKGTSDAAEHDNTINESKSKIEIKDVTTEMLEPVSETRQHDGRSNAGVLEPRIEQKNSADGMLGSVDAKEGAMDRKPDVQDDSNVEMIELSSITKPLDKLTPAHVAGSQNNEEGASEDERTSRVARSSSGEVIAATGWDENDEVDDAKVKIDEEQEGTVKTDTTERQKRARVEDENVLSPFAFDEEPLNKRYRFDVGATSIDESDVADGDSEVEEVAELYALFDKYDEHKIDRAKSMLYSAGSAVHRGRGFERKFAEYWEAMTLRISDTLSNHTTERCRVAFKAFLKTKKLRRLHNKYVLGEIAVSSLVSVPLNPFSPFSDHLYRPDGAFNLSPCTAESSFTAHPL
jgi:hypothetical protein